MQDARDRGWPPSLMFGIKPNRRPGAVTKLDVLLADGLRYYEDGLCGGCGTPAVWAYDAASARYYQLDPNPAACVVCELLEADNADPESPFKEPGLKRHIKDLRFED